MSLLTGSYPEFILRFSCAPQEFVHVRCIGIPFYVSELHITESGIYSTGVAGFYHDGIAEVVGVLIGFEQIEGDECLGAEVLPFRCPLREIGIHFTCAVVQDRRVYDASSLRLH